MTDQENTDSRNISSSRNYARFTAWGVVALVLFAGAALWALGIVFNDTRSGVHKSLEADVHQNQQLQSHEYRIEAVEVSQVHAAKDQAEMKHELSQNIKLMQSDLREIADYVLSEKVRKKALNQ